MVTATPDSQGQIPLFLYTVDTTQQTRINTFFRNTKTQNTVFPVQRFDIIICYFSDRWWMQELEIRYFIVIEMYKNINNKLLTLLIYYS